MSRNDTDLFVWLTDDGITAISYLEATDYSLVTCIVYYAYTITGEEGVSVGV